MTPASWLLPQREITGKFNDPKDGVADRLIVYIKGANTIWAHEYKGDGKPGKIPIEFEEGILQIQESNTLLLKYLEAHPWHNVHFERVDENLEAQKTISKSAKIEKALDYIKQAKDNAEIKALAVCVFDQGNNDYGFNAMAENAVQCSAKLRQVAVENPDFILEKTKNKEFHDAKYLVSLAVNLGVLTVTKDNTSIEWSDGSGSIVTVAIGEFPVDAVAKLISEQTDSALATMQKIGNGIKKIQSERGAVSTGSAAQSATQSEAVKEILTAQESEIERLKRELQEERERNAELSKQNANLAPSNDAPEATTAQAVVANSNDDDKDDDSIEALSEKYFSLFKTAVPIRYKNDKDWIKLKIDSFTPEG